MKVTIEIPDGSLAKLEALLKNTDCPNLQTLFFRGISLYALLYRLLDRGLKLLIATADLEVESVLGKEEFLGLEFEPEDRPQPTAPSN